MYLNVVSFGENEVALFVTSKTLEERQALACAFLVMSTKPEHAMEAFERYSGQWTYIPVYLEEAPIGVRKVGHDLLGRAAEMARQGAGGESASLSCVGCGRAVSEDEALTCDVCGGIVCDECVMEVISANNAGPVQRMCPVCWGKQAQGETGDCHEPSEHSPGPGQAL